MIPAVTDSTPSSPLEALLRLPATLAAELGAALPRFADRTRAQVDFAATIVEKLRCGDLGSRLSSFGAQVPERLADVVPFEPRAAADAAAGLAATVAASSPVREVIEVVTVAASTRSGAPSEPDADEAPVAAAAPAKKAPAKKAPAKKAPAKKAPAKKAPAKKAAPAKQAAPAKKAPAKKAPAKKAPAKKAPVAAAAAPAPAPVTEPTGPVLESTLAIPGYDALAASQVVPRLESLSASDLEQVRSYELAGRGRRTILSRIAQLQAG